MNREEQAEGARRAIINALRDNGFDVSSGYDVANFITDHGHDSKFEDTLIQMQVLSLIDKKQLDVNHHV